MIQVITHPVVNQIWIDGVLFGTTEDAALAEQIEQARKIIEERRKQCVINASI